MTFSRVLHLEAKQMTQSEKYYMYAKINFQPKKKNDYGWSDIYCGTQFPKNANKLNLTYEEHWLY